MLFRSSADQFKKYTFSTFDFKVILVLNVTKVTPIALEMVMFWSGGKDLLRECDGDAVLAFARMAARLGLATCVVHQIESESLQWALDGPHAPYEGWYSPLSDIVKYLDVEFDLLPDNEEFELDSVTDGES